MAGKNTGGKSAFRKSPFQALAKKFEKIFGRANAENESDATSKVHSAIANMRVSADRQKEVEKAIQEQLRRQKEAETERKRQDLLESTSASTPWKPKPRPGDESYPSLRSSKSVKSEKSAKTTPPKSPVSTTAAPSVADSDGLEPPPAIDIDDEPTANSVRTSSLRLLLEDLAKGGEHQKGKEALAKKMQSMAPKELVETRRKNDEAWRRFMQENTVMAMAEAMPTDADRKKAAENTKRSAAHRTKVSFNSKVETILAPTGTPYKAKESTKSETVPLDTEPSKN